MSYPTESIGYVNLPTQGFQTNEITGIFSSPNGDFDVTGKLQELDQTRQWGKVLPCSKEVQNNNMLDELERTTIFGKATNSKHYPTESTGYVRSSSGRFQPEITGILPSPSKDFEMTEELGKVGLKEHFRGGIDTAETTRNNQDFFPLADTSLISDQCKVKSSKNDSLNSVNNLMFNLGINRSQQNKTTAQNSLEQLDNSSNYTLRDSSPNLKTKDIVEKMFHQTLDQDKLSLNVSRSTDETGVRPGNN